MLKMPKRITITLANPVYDRLMSLSELRDKPPATLSAEAVEEMIKAAIAAGLISDIAVPARKES
jgi:predicted DNA-binding protein